MLPAEGQGFNSEDNALTVFTATDEKVLPLMSKSEACKTTGAIYSRQVIKIIKNEKLISLLNVSSITLYNHAKFLVVVC